MIEYYRWATIILYIAWIAGAAGMAVVVASHLHHYQSVRRRWGFTGYILLGMLILGASDALTRAFWLPWHIGAALDIAWMQSWVIRHQWINVAGSALIVVGYWVTGLAFQRVHRGRDASATQDISEIQAEMRRRTPWR